MKRLLLVLILFSFIGNSFASDFNAFDETQTITQLTKTQVELFDNFETFKTIGNKVFAVFDYPSEADQLVLFSCISNVDQDWREIVCKQGLLESNRFVKTFELPDCEPFYITEVLLIEKDYCKICPAPLILSNWDYLLTLGNGQIIESRKIESFIGTGCEGNIVSQIRLGDSVQKGVYWDAGEELFFGASAIIFIIAVYFIIIKRK